MAVDDGGGFVSGRRSVVSRFFKEVDDVVSCSSCPCTRRMLPNNLTKTMRRHLESEHPHLLREDGGQGL